MRRFTRRTAHINNGNNADDAGGVTLETALVMPVFLLFVFFLLFLVQTSVVTMAVQGAVSQSVRSAASSWYPISQLKANAQDQSGKELPHWAGKLSGAAETIGEFGRLLPSPLNEWSQTLAEGTQSVEQRAAELTFRQLILGFANSRIVEPGRLSLTSVHLPEDDDPSGAFVKVEAEYRLPFRVPFSNRPLTIRTTAQERAWVGGTPSKATLSDGEGTGSALQVSFVSLEPSPVRPGRKATLVLRTTPGSTLDLSVLYKSGPSKAKHLGSATADSSGLVTWTWHVSGNTTPGEWNWEVSGAGGGSWRQSFQVAGKKAEGETR
ncbi:hypothetical protein E5161_14510 [Cohnella pontilimi]|uniref:Pilus assembly protein n=1 Tax=Cohnella pontilimi TaxID=2564100 RepID=A0A4U0F8D4_9BACL|nr:TadE/TadG family type IV pilus assembly protein [Cohnella pontilimi]TJY40925.1 hypothetical protein E5161_14510 [Cohnella pontilimi]